MRTLALTTAAVLALALGASDALAQGRGPGGGGPGGGGPGGAGGGPGGIIQRIIQAFHRQDANNSGGLDASEVPPQVWQHLQAADADGDGEVTLAELRAFVQSHHPGGGGSGSGSGSGGGGAGSGGSPAGGAGPIMQRIANAFRSLDKNNSGGLDVTEVPAQAWQVLQLADADGNGEVTPPEIRAYLQAQAQQAQAIRQAFQAADANHDGKLDASEWPATASATHADVDANHDGNVTGAEVARYALQNGGQSPL